MEVSNRVTRERLGNVHGLRRSGLFFSLLATIGIGLFSTSSANPDSAQELSAVAKEFRQIVAFDGDVFSGPGYQTLIQEGQNAHFFLVGEEHGIAENPLLIAQLFSDLSDYGYGRLAIEVSPPMASALDQAAASGGLQGLIDLYEQPGGEPAFFGMQQEAELLVSVRKSVPDDQPAFWGCDYEVAGDRTLLRRLDEIGPPETARGALNELVRVSETSWRQWEETGNPGFVFSFSADPQLVENLRENWPNRNAEVAQILDTLEQTLLINQSWVAGDGYGSNVLRGHWLRQNFLNHWQSLPATPDRPRVMAKFGASHVVRGLNMTHTWDIGSLVPELAQIEGLKSVSVLVLPRPEAQIARLDPTQWTYVPAPAKGGYSDGLDPLIGAAYDDHFTLIPLKPLRAEVTGGSHAGSDDLIKTVTGFDYLLVMSGSTPSSELVHE